MVDIIGKKYYFFALSAVLIIAGIVGYMVHGGFNYDIQFKGGIILEMRMSDSNFDTKKAEDIALSTLGVKAGAQKSQTLNAADATKKIDILTLNIPNDKEFGSDSLKKLEAAIIKEYNLNADNAVISEQSVQPFIGNEIKVNGLKATFWASILIIIYIWWRFRVMSGLSAGVMAVVALLHDVAILLSVYTVFNIPLNESFIAAVLTILGYSMNDTIIIYDRIRENSNLLRKFPIGELVNKSILQTLARSINTVLTVLVCIITIFIYASINNISSVKEFSFPLMVGIASGCYSSIFVASPLFVMWKEYQSKKKISARPAKA